MRRRRHGGTRAPEGDVEGREVGWDRAGSGGGDHRGLGLLEQPLDGLAVGLVAKLSGQLENPSCARRRHSDPTAPAVDLSVPVLG